MRTAEIFYQDVLAGILTETNEGHFIFQYDEQYVIDKPNQFLTFTMPVTKYPYHDKHLFSFFEGFLCFACSCILAKSAMILRRSDWLC